MRFLLYFGLIALHLAIIGKFQKTSAFSLRENEAEYEKEQEEELDVQLLDHHTEKHKHNEDENDVFETQSNLKPMSLMTKKCEPCAGDILCVPLIQCPAHIRMDDYEKPQICDLPDGAFGYCCQTGQNHTAHSIKSRHAFLGSFLPPEVLEEGRKKFERLMHGIAQIAVTPGHPDFAHGIAFHSTPQDELQNYALSNSALEQIITSQVYSKKENLPVDDIITNNIHVKFTQTPLAQHCQPSPICHNVKSIYRTFDGTCNNPSPPRSLWGAAGQGMERLLPPGYEDGIWTPRVHSIDGTPLLSARDISRLLLPDLDRPHPKYNLMFMQFGQFLAHDLSQTAAVRLEDGSLVQCCSEGGRSPLLPHQTHFACMPITVSHDDEFYGEFGVRCLNFVRLGLVPSADCQIGYGKQRNKVTHFLDASMVYGSSEAAARDLRTFQGGRLRMLDDFGRDLLPLTQDRATCNSEESTKTCFKSGDGRTNQIITLIVLHVVFAREHNRLAKGLAQLNPSATDEWLFQEARRIVIAELQHITYNEYLPALLGPQLMRRFRLLPRDHGYAKGYNPEVNPAIINEFSGAAFRMGHSSVDGKFRMQRSDSQLDELIKIPDVMFNPSRMRKRNFYDDMLRTLYTQPMQRVDSSISHGLSRYLFLGHGPFGLDLAAINIQRGRDHALRSYNDYRALMGKQRIRKFDQLTGDIGRRLEQVYRHPDDIDLWVGGLLEEAVNDGVVGNTFAEIIADQFSRLKQGDRYYYEYDPRVNPGAFSPPQLHELRKVTLTRLICDNADHLTLQVVPTAAFERADWRGNQIISCMSPHLPALNLNAWRR